MTQKKETPSLQKCAKGLIDLVLDATGHDLVFREFSRREPDLKNVTFETFCVEYVPSKLALGCAYWRDCCENHRIEGKEEQNIFFREVMSLFESPKSLENATRFSESLYASNADKDHPPMISVLVHLFHKLKLTATGKADSEIPEVSPGFYFMVEASEALRSVFEEQFDEFIYSNEDFRT
ncbi:MAG TPA: hypothetical protein PLL75_04140 [Candidatus Omnitrophota bacterium]|nr:hypothetical protein [Candidatus Omnitrophota bacterium]HPS36899.1 hypothetical protein [Candidatus Omnitrophota bacterium]